MPIMDISLQGISACWIANDEIKDSAYSNHYGIIKAYNQLYNRAQVLSGNSKQPSPKNSKGKSKGAVSSSPSDYVPVSTSPQTSYNQY